MSIVDILIEGYAREGENGVMFASPTTILVRDSDKWILVDPGSNKPLLLKALSERKLTPEDIDIVFLTHYHPDHFLNIRLFPDKDIYDGSTIYRNDEEIPFSGKIPETNIEVIDTPGHVRELASLIVHTEEGVYVIAEDVFWWMDGIEQKTDRESLMNLKDPYMTDWEALQKSRELVLSIADFVIPGHGKMFKVEK